MRPSGAYFNIKIPSYQYKDSHYKDRMVSSISGKAVTDTGPFTLQWSSNEWDGISNHQSHDCLLKCLFRRRSEKTSKLWVTGLCEWNSLVTSEFPSQRASNVENHFHLMTSSWHEGVLPNRPNRGQAMCRRIGELGHHQDSANGLLHAQCQAITNADWSLVKSSDIHIRAISQQMPQPSITKICLKMTCLKFHSNFPRDNELTSLWPRDTIWCQDAVCCQSITYCKDQIPFCSLVPRQHLNTSIQNCWLPAISSMFAQATMYGPLNSLAPGRFQFNFR